MKKFVSVLASLALALVLIPAVVFATNSDDIDLATCTISEIAAQDCTGAAIEPAISVTYGGETLSASTEYTVSYSDNVAPGTASVTITAVEDSGFTGTQTVEFTINDSIVFTVYDADINGTYCKAIAEYTYGEMLEMAAENDTTIAGFYSKKGSAYIQATSSYVTFDQLAAAAYEAAGLADPWNDATDASAVKASVNCNGDNFGWGTGYTKEALTTTYGTYFADATYVDSTFVSPSKEGVAVPAAVGLTYDSATFSTSSTADEQAAALAGAATPEFRTYVGNSCDSETGAITTPAGSMMCTDINEIYFYHEIDQLDLAYATISEVADQDCTGKAIEPSVTVTDAKGYELTANTEYTVSYANNVEPGTATITIEAVEEGGYTGSQTIEFTINDNVVYTIYDIELDEEGNAGEAQVVAEYTYGELQALAAQNEGNLYTIYNSSNVQASTSYITFDQIIADAYAQSSLADPWNNAVDDDAVYARVMSLDGTGWGTKGNTVTKYYSKKTLSTTYGYFYPNLTSSNVDDSDAVVSPAAICLNYTSAKLSSYSNAQAAGEAAAAEVATELRTSIGTSITDGTLTTPAGYLMWTDIQQLYVYHYELPADLSEASVYASRMNKVLSEGSITVQDSDVRVYVDGAIIDSSCYTFEVVDAEGNVVADNTITETGTYYIKVTGDGSGALGSATGRIIIIDQNTKTYTITSK